MHRFDILCQTVEHCPYCMHVGVSSVAGGQRAGSDDTCTQVFVAVSDVERAYYMRTCTAYSIF